MDNVFLVNVVYIQMILKILKSILITVPECTLVHRPESSVSESKVQLKSLLFPEGPVSVQ